jgi:hypothetical protein
MSEVRTTDDESGDDPDGGDGGNVTLTLGDREIVLRHRFELISIANEIGIAVFFTVGSVAFYFEPLFDLGVTLFVIGSVQLGIRPAIRLARRVQLRRVTKGMPGEVARDF